MARLAIPLPITHTARQRAVSPTLRGRPSVNADPDFPMFPPTVDTGASPALAQRNDAPFPRIAERAA